MILILILAFTLLLCGSYSILADVLHIAPFRSAALTTGFKEKKKKSVLTDILDVGASRLARFIPMFEVGKIRLAQTLGQAGISKTPQEYIARLILIGILLCGGGSLLLLVNQTVGILMILLGLITVFILYKDAREKAKERSAKIETQLPYFIDVFGTSIKHNPSVIDILEMYRRNYNNELSSELATTIADMRTGVPAIALQRLDTRMNIPLLSELIRGILSSMAGDDMSAYFDALIIKSNSKWRQSLTQKALKVKRKFSSMSLLLAVYAIISMLIVALSLFLQGGLSF